MVVASLLREIFIWGFCFAANPTLNTAHDEIFMKKLRS